MERTNGKRGAESEERRTGEREPMSENRSARANEREPKMRETN